MPSAKFKAEFKSLQLVHAALTPLNPESRRRVIEAVHTLIKVASGKVRPDKKSRGGK